MITINELRFGNYVKAPQVYEEKIMVYSRSNEDNTIAFFQNGSIYGIGEYINRLVPIELNEEWFLKLGFEKHYESRFRTTYELIIDGRCWCFNIAKTGHEKSYFEIKGMGMEAPKYVHQLQNLFFAINQIELIIK